MVDTIKQKIDAAFNDAEMQKYYLKQKLDVFLALQGYDRDLFSHQLDVYVAARARYEVLQLLNSEDLFVMLSRSASKVGEG